VSVEHDAAWHQRVSPALGSGSGARVWRRDLDDGDAYVAAIDELAGPPLDLVTVDGRRRVDCVRRALDRVRPGGYLLLDDSHRPRYAPALELLTDWERSCFDFGLLQTTIWRRPR
jgi:hypothetical protein